MKIKNMFLSVAAGILVFVWTGCKQGTDTVTNISDPVTTAVQMTAQGWQSFEGGDYAKAVELFKGALQNNNLYTDAYNGLGWSYGRMDSLDKAKVDFDIALGLDNTFIDAYAGRSFVSLAQGRYAEAIEAVDVVEQSGRTFYAFRHDTHISMNDLQLVKAQSYFFLSDYDSAQNIIDDLDPDNTLDPTQSNYIDQLSLEIENLWKTI